MWELLTGAQTFLHLAVGEPSWMVAWMFKAVQDLTHHLIGYKSLGPSALMGPFIS